jgi:hypothetical protein
VIVTVAGSGGGASDAETGSASARVIPCQRRVSAFQPSRRRAAARSRTRARADQSSAASGTSLPSVASSTATVHPSFAAGASAPRSFVRV